MSLINLCHKLIIILILILISNLVVAKEITFVCNEEKRTGFRYFEDKKNYIQVNFQPRSYKAKLSTDFGTQVFLYNNDISLNVYCEETIREALSCGTKNGFTRFNLNYIKGYFNMSYAISNMGDFRTKDDIDISYGICVKE